MTSHIKKEETIPGGGNELAGVECPNGRVAFDRRACEVDSVLVVKPMRFKERNKCYPISPKVGKND